MKEHLTLAVAVLLVLDQSICHSYSVAGMDGNGGSCTYNVQVWRPSEDVIKRIENMENKCENNTSHLLQKLTELKFKLRDQIYYSQNQTQAMEKQLLKYQVDDTKFDNVCKELKIQILENRAESSKIWAFINQIQSSLLKGVLNGQHPTLPPLTTPVSDQRVSQTSSELPGVVSMLRNRVGNLQAEWIQIKRDVKAIKSDSTELKRSMDDLKEDSFEIRGSTKWVKEELRRMNHSLEKMKGENYKHQNDDTFDLTAYPYDDELYEGIEEMRTKYSTLTKDMAVVSENCTSLQQQLDELVQTVTVTPPPSHSPTSGHGDTHHHKHNKGKVDRSTKVTQTMPKDCHEVYLNGHTTSGVYQVRPLHAGEADNVYCEMLNQSGWTLLQRRENGLLSFDRLWMEYKYGFGSLYGEFWIGNEMIHLLTSQGEYVLRIDMWDWEGHKAYAEYNSFRVGSEISQYKLSVKIYHGNAGDSLSAHDGMSFTTNDKDNDLDLHNCAYKYKGGWWFNSCYASHLNGLYHTGRYAHKNRPVADGIVWYTYKETEFYSMKKVEMKVRPYYT